jgi:PelA/Pel-15E family pectate lyase
MFSRRSMLGRTLAVALLALAQPAAAEPTRAEIARTMRRATEFMVEKVAVNGGYVWSYLPDFSKRWGEIEAYPTMIWVQPPGTATMGHVYLDAYHATGDEYYYQAAEKVAGALIWGQHPSGGWNYFIDFAGETSTKRWYDTIGANAWRMEEFQHYWGNATFDDAGTSEASQFLLRLYIEKRDPKYRPAVERALQFVLDSQYPIGGWPQRYPLRHDFVHHGRPDYTSYITFNDDVAAENIRFLLMCQQVLGDTRVRDAIYRAMNAFLVTQQGAPQAGWALQYTPGDLKPAGARTYEPLSLSPGTTAANVRHLMNFYRMTGDTKFLARIPEALDWIESTRMKSPPAKGGNMFPTFVEIGTNRPLFVHRRGSNVVNGEYYVDYSAEKTLGHYSATRTIDVAALRREFAELKAKPPADLTRGSPLESPEPVPLPRLFVAGMSDSSDLNSGGVTGSVADLVAALNDAGYWPTMLKATSNPYRGPGPKRPAAGDFATTRVGDATDTSPYVTDRPVVGISTGTYIENMSALIRHLEARR